MERARRPRRFWMWVARIALAEIVVGTLVVICLIPGHSHIHFNGGTRGLTTTWPIPRSFGHYHPGADILMFIGDVLVGLAAVILIIWFLAYLIKMAHLKGDTET